jgi:general stress protein 26
LIASDSLNIYFITWRRSRKFQQIERNPNVCLCKDIVEVEGVAEILGKLNNAEGAEI